MEALFFVLLESEQTLLALGCTGGGGSGKNVFQGHSLYKLPRKDSLEQGSLYFCPQDTAEM